MRRPASRRRIMLALAGARAGALALAPLAAVGCATGSTAPPATPAPVVGEDGPAALPSLGPAVTHEAESGVARFAAHEGPGAPGVIEVETAREPGGGDGAWIVTRRIAGEDAPYLTERFVRLADGSVALRESVNAREGVISRFEPPMVVAPASVAPGSPFRQTLAITVHPIGDPSAVQDRGPATHEIAYLGDALVELHAWSPARAAHVRSVFRARLAAASVVNTSDAWHALPAGSAAYRPALLVRSDDERASFLGIQVRANRSSISRLPEPGEGPPPTTQPAPPAPPAQGAGGSASGGGKSAPQGAGQPI